MEIFLCAVEMLREPGIVGCLGHALEVVVVVVEPFSKNIIKLQAANKK